MNGPSIFTRNALSPVLPCRSTIASHPCRFSPRPTSHPAQVPARRVVPIATFLLVRPFGAAEPRQPHNAALPSVRQAVHARVHGLCSADQHRRAVEKVVGTLVICVHHVRPDVLPTPRQGEGVPMAAYGYGNVSDRGFVAFDRELEEGAWKDIITHDHEVAAKQNIAALLTAPLPVVWKIRLRWGIANVIAVLGAPALAKLDEAWDSSQRRLFHRIAIGVDSESPAIRAAADRLRDQLLTGTGIAQTQLSCDDEVDFGLRQIALTQEGGPLAADAKKAKITDALADVQKTTEALATALGRSGGEKRKAPSKRMRDALSACVSAFNGVHDQIMWFLAQASPGAERDQLMALVEPLEALLARTENPPATPTPENPAPTTTTG